MRRAAVVCGVILCFLLVGSWVCIKASFAYDPTLDNELIPDANGGAGDPWSKPDEWDIGGESDQVVIEQYVEKLPEPVIQRLKEAIVLNIGGLLLQGEDAERYQNGDMQVFKGIVQGAIDGLEDEVYAQIKECIGTVETIDKVILLDSPGPKISVLFTNTEGNKFNVSLLGGHPYDIYDITNKELLKFGGGATIQMKLETKYAPIY